MASHHELNVLVLSLLTQTNTVALPNPYAKNLHDLDENESAQAQSTPEHDTNEQIATDIAEYKTQNEEMRKLNNRRTEFRDLTVRQLEWTKSLNHELGQKSRRLEELDQKNLRLKELEAETLALRMRPTEEDLDAAIQAKAFMQEDLDFHRRITAGYQLRPSRKQYDDAIGANNVLETRISELEKRPTQQRLEEAVKSATRLLLNELEQRPTQQHLDDAITNAVRPLKEQIFELEKRPTQQMLEDAVEKKTSPLAINIATLKQRPTQQALQDAVTIAINPLNTKIATLEQRPTQKALQDAVTDATDPLNTKIATLEQRPTQTMLAAAVATATGPLNTQLTHLRQRPTQAMLNAAVATATGPLNTQLTHLRQRPTQAMLAAAVATATGPINTELTRLRQRPTQAMLNAAVATATGPLNTQLTNLRQRPTEQNLQDAVAQASEHLNNQITELKKRPTQEDVDNAMANATRPLEEEVVSLRQRPSATDLENAVANSKAGLQEELQKKVDEISGLEKRPTQEKLESEIASVRQAMGHQLTEAQLSISRLEERPTQQHLESSVRGAKQPLENSLTLCRQDRDHWKEQFEDAKEANRVDTDKKNEKFQIEIRELETRGEEAKTALQDKLRDAKASNDHTLGVRDDTIRKLTNDVLYQMNKEQELSGLLQSRDTELEQLRVDAHVALITERKQWQAEKKEQQETKENQTQSNLRQLYRRYASAEEGRKHALRWMKISFAALYTIWGQKQAIMDTTGAQLRRQREAIEKLDCAASEFQKTQHRLEMDLEVAEKLYEEIKTALASAEGDTAETGRARDDAQEEVRRLTETLRLSREMVATGEAKLAKTRQSITEMEARVKTTEDATLAANSKTSSELTQVTEQLAKVKEASKADTTGFNASLETSKREASKQQQALEQFKAGVEKKRAALGKRLQDVAHEKKLQEPDELLTVDEHQLLVDVQQKISEIRTRHTEVLAYNFRLKHQRCRLLGLIYNHIGIAAPYNSKAEFQKDYDDLEVAMDLRVKLCLQFMELEEKLQDACHEKVASLGRVVARLLAQNKTLSDLMEAPVQCGCASTISDLGNRVRDLEKKLGDSIEQTRRAVGRYQATTKSMLRDIELLHNELTTVSGAYNMIKQFVDDKVKTGALR
ncbi:uncharacterized protein J4E79_008125 [Alternaria viburni]|uniref:uncharacterized protein n=1 Tax=Alternaria viburni TaxID=566460 RepID=UPI0020C5129A|nr:uncharacterized protein J4E79_008125 [Alternaria viburni]KAI4655060.1 hypothetical protein J4E79_008125 [Alternaria viburni]